MLHVRGLVVGAIVLGWAMAGTAEGATWNPTAEFSITNGNPNGVWSYGTMPVGFGTLELMTSSSPGGGHPGWQASNAANIWRNDGTDTAFGVTPGQMSLHPGSDTQPCVLRWTAPPGAPSTVHVSGRFFAGDSGNMLVQVRFNSSATIATGYEPFDVTLGAVVAGDTIDFAVYGGYGFGNTPLEVTISDDVGACFADFNQDGGVDGSDVDAFFAAWEAGDSGADVNADGGVDGPDVEAFFAQWEAGGC